jgi:cellobiose phosphorylase
MYRLITESLLGLILEVDKLRFAPCLPESWTTFKIHYRYRETHYHITFHSRDGGSAVERVSVDGNEQRERCVPLIDDRNDHNVDVELAPASAPDANGSANRASQAVTSKNCAP